MAELKMGRNRIFFMSARAALKDTVAFFSMLARFGALGRPSDARMTRN
jgi:hypothetical protein